MTVTYSNRVATSSFSCFLKLLCRWRGSIYKLIWKDFAAFAIIFYFLSFVYRFALPETGKRYFEAIAIYCEKFNNLIPLAFILGFYVSLVVSRFWEQLNALPWPSRLAVFVSTLVQGYDDRSRLIRRTIVRYLTLAYVLTMRQFCQPVLRRFPDFDTMIGAGIMTDDEKEVLEEIISSRKKKPAVYFVPLVWGACLINLARKEGRVKDDFAVKTLIDEINDYRGKCGTLFCYDWVNVPLVYTQVVTIAVYTFFLSCLMGRQYLEKVDAEHETELYFPVFTFLQFLFYMGWLKVAEMLINPFGEDDDDFEINGLIDSNLDTSYLIVDDMYAKLPKLVEDKFWNKPVVDMPYTKDSEQFRVPEFEGSAMANPKRQSMRVGSLTGDDEEKIQTDGISVRGPRGVFENLSQSVRNKFTRSTSRVNEAGSEGAPSPSKTSKVVPAKYRGSSATVPYGLSLQSTQEETQFEMSDIDVAEDNKLLPDKTSGQLPMRKKPTVPLARIDSVTMSEYDDDISDTANFQTENRNLGTSVMSQGFVNDVRQQLKLMREMSCDETPKQSLPKDT